MLLLIDNRISDTSFILNCLESHVTPVIFDFQKDTFDSLAEKIPEQRYRRLGILQENNNPDIYCMLESFGESILKDVEILDPTLETWTSFHLFIELCVSRLEIKSLDLLDSYESKNWGYISHDWNLPIESSKLEKMNNFDQWIGSPLIDLYFKKNTTILQDSTYEPIYTIRAASKPIPVQRTIMHKLLNKFKLNNLQN